MSGASFTHNLITGNIFAELHTRLKGSGYVVFANEMRVSIPSVKSYFYPDVGVVCEEPVLKTMSLTHSLTRLLS